MHFYYVGDNYGPDACDEWGLVGWEFALWCYVGLPERGWFKANENRSIENDRDGSSFGEASPRTREIVINERLRFARKARIVDPAGRPVPVTRKLDVRAMHKHLIQQASRHRNIAASKPLIRCGRDFEEWASSQGFAAGYTAALQDFVATLGSMV